MKQDHLNAWWRKSSHSGGNGDCVQLARIDGTTRGVRDSKDPHGDVIETTPAGLRSLVAKIKTGELG